MSSRFEELRKQPGVQASLDTISELRKQEILTKVGPRAAEAKKPKFMGHEVFEALLTVRHKHQAVNAFVLRQLQLFDATIGDASCEQRVPLIMDCDDRVAAIRKDGDEAIVQDYITAHASDKADTKVRTMADVLGAKHAPAYDALVQRVEAALGEDMMTLARLCFTFTKTAVWAKDEMDFLFAFRAMSLMDVAGETALASGQDRDLIKIEGDLRVDLAHIAVAAFQNKVAKLPRYEAPIPNAPQYFIENQLLLASQLMHSYVPTNVPHPVQDINDEAPHLENEMIELPILPIFNQMLAIFYMCYHEDRGIIVRVRRGGMTPIASGSSNKQRFTEQWGGIYYLVFKPNHDTGLFEVYEPSDSEDYNGFMLMDAFGKFPVGTNGTGLDARGLDEHKAALAGSNLLWLILQFAATHPDYPGTAADKEIDYAAGYQAVCVPQPKGVAFHPTREQFPELNLKVNQPNEIRPNLHDLWTLARQFGEQRDLHDNCQIILGPFGRDIYERLNRPTDLQFDHIYPVTLKWVKDDTAAIEAKHTAAPNAVMGPIVARLGAGCLSFPTIEKAREVLAIKNDNQKKAQYKKLYPENASLVRA